MSPRAIRILLTTTALAVLVLCTATIRVVPGPTRDGQLYASIARARQLYGVGVPTVTWNSPVAVDHVPFYGPVFFDIVAFLIGILGPKLIAFRLASLLGVLVFLAAGARLGKLLSGERDGWLVAAALLLLAPETNEAISTGMMHMLAVGLETLALAVFIDGVLRGADTWRGACAGALLSAAALTTPRSYLFIASFLCAGTSVLVWQPQARRTVARPFVVAIAVLALVLSAWATISHGSPIRWLRYMVYIGLHEDTDVAVLSTAVRDWSFGWSLILTPLVAVAGGLAASCVTWTRRRDADTRDVTAMTFALITGWTTFFLTFVIMNLTWATGEYFSLPLLAVVLATPRRWLGGNRRLLAVAVVAVLACDLGVLSLRYVRAAATWAARDPDPLNAFVDDQVPDGAEVVGPEAPYFFPVERSHARYRTVLARSWADWARWVPIIEPEATRIARQIPIPAPTGRFLLWPQSDEVPADYACALAHVVAVYHAPPNSLYRLGRLGVTADDGYPSSVLYRLTPDCPHGYDPTGVRDQLQGQDQPDRALPDPP